MLFYSLKWSKTNYKKNRIKVNIKGITADGETKVIQKLYDEWIGICTKNIQKTIALIRKYFPGSHLNFKQLNTMQYKKIFPKFKDRLFKKKLLYKPKNFYKLYSNNVTINDIGIVMDKYKISYYTPNDWLNRLYIDLCTTNNTNNFYYMWYEISDSDMLLDAMKINVNYQEKPEIKIASFDLETVPMDGENRVPTGHDENDKIVMVSIVKWNYKYEDSSEKILLYLNPLNIKLNDIPQHCIEFFDEGEMLKKFHTLVQDCHILTGYNINNFDLPCLLARMVLLNLKYDAYSSKKFGNYLIVTFQEKIVIDMYHFIQIFSSYNLPSFKLDTVAKFKLNKSKFPVKSTTIHYFYTHLNADALQSKDKNFVYNLFAPKNIALSEFGTFFDCLEYCLEDSVLVYELFKKEFALTFLIERANVTSIDMEQALHLGNTKYILEVFKTYGTCMGYFFNMEFFDNTVENDLENYKQFLILKNKSYTYQGALNYGEAGGFYKNVAGLDFLSMYPSILINQNLSYETSGLIFMDEYLKLSDDLKNQCECVPYRNHSEKDILTNDKFDHTVYKQPEIDLQKDKLIMISYKDEMGFLPTISNVFLEKRKEIQKQYKITKQDTLYTRQLNIKLFLNSIYGTMACNDSPLAYVDIAMSITCFARLYLLAVSEFTQQVLGYITAYCDTDGIFVVGYPYKNCDLINQYLNQKFMILQFEKVMSCLLIISKKRYIYESNGKKILAGFQKKANTLTKWMSETIVDAVLHALKTDCKNLDASQGWVVWVNTLVNAFLMCRNPKTFCITRKTKQLHEYKSKTCPQLKIIKKNPSKAGEYIEYTYSQTDVAASQSSKWIMEVDECEQVNFEKLFIGQKKIFIDLLNRGFFGLKDARKPCEQVLNTMRWKSFLNTEISTYLKERRELMILVLKSVKYTFHLNDCTHQ